ncbi:MAG: hypothetical protein VXW22_07415 [Pseudomonadota bacterium]|jgi:hypothetical protein|nr:hypothetical protein [Pseudomonadota bacterium]
MDLEDKNAIGGLDRLITNVALAVIAVFPTLGAAFVMPWKLAPLLSSDEPDGRKSMLLSPGAFLPLSLTVILLFAATVSTSETVASNGGAIGPGLAVDVAQAASEGDLWRTVSLIAPIYILAIVIAVLSQLLRRWIGSWWTLRTALRAAFYQVAVTVCWIIVSSSIIDAYRVATNNHEVGRLLYDLNSIPIFGISLWLFFWFFQSDEKTAKLTAMVLAFAMFALTFAFISGAGWLFGQI